VPRDDVVEFEISEPVIAETANAILVDVDGEQVWLPLSQVHDDSEVYAKGHTGKLVITEWIAKQKGLI
jgi:hypothetical protein